MSKLSVVIFDGEKISTELGVVSYDKDGDPICEICGKASKKLGSHVFMVHGMRAADYKRLFGLNQRQSLISEESRLLASRRNKENFNDVVKNNLIKGGVKTRFKKGDKGRTRDKLTPQTLIQLGENSRRMHKKFSKKMSEVGRKLGESGAGNQARWGDKKTKGGK